MSFTPSWAVAVLAPLILTLIIDGSVAYPTIKCNQWAKGAGVKLTDSALASSVESAVSCAVYVNVYKSGVAAFYATSSDTAALFPSCEIRDRNSDDAEIPFKYRQFTPDDTYPVAILMCRCATDSCNTENFIRQMMDRYDALTDVTIPANAPPSGSDSKSCTVKTPYKSETSSSHTKGSCVLSLYSFRSIPQNQPIYKTNTLDSVSMTFCFLEHTPLYHMWYCALQKDAANEVKTLKNQFPALMYFADGGSDSDKSPNSGKSISCYKYSGSADISKLSLPSDTDKCSTSCLVTIKGSSMSSATLDSKCSDSYLPTSCNYAKGTLECTCGFDKCNTVEMVKYFASLPQSPFSSRTAPSSSSNSGGGGGGDDSKDKATTSAPTAPAAPASTTKKD